MECGANLTITTETTHLSPECAQWVCIREAARLSHSE